LGKLSNPITFNQVNIDAASHPTSFHKTRRPNDAASVLLYHEIERSIYVLIEPPKNALVTILLLLGDLN